MKRESMTCRARNWLAANCWRSWADPGVYEEEKYPFIKDEITVIEKRLNFGRPAIGICFGAQLFARALGSRVYAEPGMAERARRKQPTRERVLSSQWLVENMF
jgi:gamma-glutamyl-gamma-aminobutyrate hydrolase PuuD